MLPYRTKTLVQLCRECDGIAPQESTKPLFPVGYSRRGERTGGSGKVCDREFSRLLQWFRSRQALPDLHLLRLV